MGRGVVGSGEKPWPTPLTPSHCGAPTHQDRLTSCPERSAVAAACRMQQAGGGAALGRLEALTGCKECEVMSDLDCG